MNGLRLLGLLVIALALFLLAVGFHGWLISLVWNFVMPVVFGLPAINILQAVALNILAALLGFPFVATLGFTIKG